MIRIVQVAIILVISLASRAQQPAKIQLEYFSSSKGQFQTASILVEKLFFDSSSQVWVIRDRSQYMPQISWRSKSKPFRYSLPDDRWMYSISTTEFATLKRKGKMDFEGQPLQLISGCEENTYNIGGKLVNVLIAENYSGRLKIWILDNAHLPLILKTEGNWYNGDIELVNLR